MRKLVTSTLIALVVGLTAAPAAAQAPTPPPTYEAAVLRTWKNLHNKILAMAKDTVFPEAKLRTSRIRIHAAYDEFRHVTIGLEMTTALGKGEKFDFEAKEKDDARPQSRGAIVKEMEAAIAASYPVLDTTAEPLLDRLARSPGRALRQAGDVVSRERRVPPISRPK